SGARKKAAKKKAPPVKALVRPTPPDRIPRVVENPALSDHLAIITRAIFQAGLSWAFIDARWDRYMAEFDEFDVEKIAAYDEAAVTRLMQAADIVHSRAKIEGTIRNARVLLAIEREFGSIRAYQTSFASYDALRRDTQKRFAYLGDMTTYYWLFRTGAAIPDIETWMKTQDVDHPRIREMVTAASP
nr:DNA-3-methyladenine glycosylase I [Candidatus Eremiobacteraeota bacterium]